MSYTKKSTPLRFLVRASGKAPKLVGGLVLSKEAHDYLDGAASVLNPLPAPGFDRYLHADVEALADDWSKVNVDIASGFREAVAYYSDNGGSAVISKNVERRIERSKHADRSKQKERA